MDSFYSILFALNPRMLWVHFIVNGAIYVSCGRILSTERWVCGTQGG